MSNAADDERHTPALPSASEPPIETSTCELDDGSDGVLFLEQGSEDRYVATSRVYYLENWS